MPSHRRLTLDQTCQGEEGTIYADRHVVIFKIRNKFYFMKLVEVQNFFLKDNSEIANEGLQLMFFLNCASSYVLLFIINL